MLKNDEGERREVSRIGKGGYFGELGLISHQPRAADVVAFGPKKCADEQLRFILG